MSADLDMNSNQILNLPAAVSGTEPIRKAEFDEALVDLTVAGVAAGTISNEYLQTMEQATIKGRASGAGTGSPQDLTATQVATIVDSFFLTPTEGDAAYQPLDSDLTSIAALTTTSFGRSLLTQADAATARATLVVNPVCDRTRIYEATRGTKIPQALNNTHVVGTSLKYTEWYPTTYAIHRWTKPTHPNFTSIIITAISGGGGGGSSASTSGADSTGGGGDGGAWHRATILAASLPTTLVFLVGHGGEAGAWGSAVHADGIHATTADDGNDGGVTAVFDATVWDALGANDGARQTAFLALSEANRQSTAIIYCQEGYGGRRYNGTNPLTAPGQTRSRLNPYGPQAFGPGDSRMGSSGAGNDAGVDDPADGFGGGTGTGGSAGGIAQTDYIYKNMASGPCGIVGRLAGAGGWGKGPVGQHEGGHGAWYGGGGGGGQKASVASTAVYPGGFGAPGVVEVIELYDAV